MKFLITGGTGLIGNRLTEILISKGHSVNILTRKAKKSNNSSVKFFIWNPSKSLIDNGCIKDVNIIINLAGSSVFSFWSKANKKQIIKSRLDSLSIIFDLLKNQKHNVKRIISASAIGIYPNNDSMLYYEKSHSISNTFLGKTVIKWESKINSFNEININVSIVRIGLVLTEKGGMLEKLLQLNKFRFSSTVSGGKQWQSWIHIDDLVGIFIYIASKKINGIINGVSPNPSTFKQIQNLVIKNNNKPILNFNLPKYFFTVPFSLIGIIDFYHDIIASNKKVSSKKIQDFGYDFKFPSLEKIK